MDSKQFCPNCGAKVKDDAAFCGECGFDLEKYFAKSQSKESVQTKENVQEENKFVNKKNNLKDKKKGTTKWITIVCAFLVVLLAGCYWAGTQYYAKERQISRIVSSIKRDKNASQYFYSNDSNLKISNKSLEPFITEMNKNRQKLAMFKQYLSNGKSWNQNFKLERNGKYFFLFPRYSVLTKGVYASISTNHAGVNIFINGQKITTTTSDATAKKIGPLVAGQYDLKAKGTVGGHKIVNENKYNITGLDPEYDLSLKTVSFDVSGYSGSKVYVNDKEVGKIGESGQYALKDFPWSEGMKVQLRYPLKGGEVTSKETPVSEGNGTTVEPIFTDLLTKEGAESDLTNLFGAVNQLSSSDDSSGNLEDYFENGKSNSDYQELRSMAKGYYKDDNIDSVSYDTKVISLEPGGHSTTNVTYQVKYTFENSSSDDAGEHIQVFQYTAKFKRVNAGKPIEADEGGGIVDHVISISPGVKISDKHED